MQSSHSRMCAWRPAMRQRLPSGYCKGTLKLDCPSWEDIHRAKDSVSRRNQWSVTKTRSHLSLRPPWDDIPIIRGSLPCLPLAVASLMIPKAPRTCLCGRLNTLVEPDRLMVLLHLGIHYQELVGASPRLPISSLRLSMALPRNRPQFPLLICLRNSQRLREALDWAREIQKTHRQSPRLALEVEAEILEHVGDVRTAVSRYQELCSRPDATLVHRVMLASAQFRCGERAAASRDSPSHQHRRTPGRAASSLEVGITKTAA